MYFKPYRYTFPRANSWCKGSFCKKGDVYFTANGTVNLWTVTQVNYIFYLWELVAIYCFNVFKNPKFIVLDTVHSSQFEICELLSYSTQITIFQFFLIVMILVHSSQLDICELFVGDHQNLQFSIWNKNVMFFWKWRELCELWTPDSNFLNSSLTGVHSSQFTAGKLWTLCRRSPKLAILNLK